MVHMLDVLRMKGARNVRLEARKSNIIAQQFYQKLGFGLGEEIPYYYEDGESAVMMALEF